MERGVYKFPYLINICFLGRGLFCNLLELAKGSDCLQTCTKLLGFATRRYIQQTYIFIKILDERNPNDSLRS